MPAQTKKCSSCQEEKSVSEFYKDKFTKDGLRYCCKDCKREKARQWHVNNLEKVKEKATQLKAEYKKKNQSKTLEQLYQEKPIKYCPRCEQDLPTTSFARGNNQSDGFYHCCVDCNRKETDYRLYKLSPQESDIAEYHRIHGTCAICGKKANGTKLCVDHDHKTKFVRGILCAHCNKALGLFYDSPELMHKATEFIDNPPGLPAIPQ